MLLFLYSPHKMDSDRVRGVKKLTKPFYLLSGIFFVLVGAVGVFLPLLPTTPFLILAAFCFSRSSKRLHEWLLNQPTFGPMIKDWEQHGVIARPAKRLATLMILVMISYPLFFKDFDWRLKFVVGTCIACVLAFIWTRPSRPTKPTVNS